jgi:hypothetical protein
MTMQLIETKTLLSAAASIEFTSIPQTFTDLAVVFSARTNRVNHQDYIVVRPNSLTSGLSARRLFGNGSLAFSFSDTVAYGGNATGGTATSDTFGNSTCYIPDYTSSTAKSFSLDGVAENNAIATGLGITASLSTNTAAITSLLFLPEVGTNFSVGSTASLYGITKGSDGITTVS